MRAGVGLEDPNGISSFTLTDAQTYSAEALGQLYFRRWAVALFCRDLKTTLSLDVLRCQNSGTR